MADPMSGDISWYSPDPRAVIPLSSFKPSRSLRRKLKRNVFHVTINTAFRKVVGMCADRADTWISSAIVDAYDRLHREGYAHSIESWHGDLLVGGLYGVALGGAFFGESMFSRETDASKVAFAHLVQRLLRNGFVLLDTQFINKHVQTLGAIEIPRSQYLNALREAIPLPTRFDDQI